MAASCRSSSTSGLLASLMAGSIVLLHGDRDLVELREEPYDFEASL